MDHFYVPISLLLVVLFPQMISPDMISDHFAANATGDLQQKQKSGESFSEKLPPNNISSHVLDISAGRPARGVKCTAYKLKSSESATKSDGGEEGIWQLWGQTETNEQGRIPIVHPGKPLSAGIFKLHFHTKEYFEGQRRDTFYPFIEVVFQVDEPVVHHHVPITLSNFGYSTYKGQ